MRREMLALTLAFVCLAVAIILEGPDIPRERVLDPATMSVLYGGGTVLALL